MVEAYKEMAREVGSVRSSVVDGTGHETVRGFIRGIELKETRYYANGDVEVVITLEVPSGGSAPAPRAGEETGPRAGIVAVEPGGGVVSDDEWRRAFGAESPPS